MEERPVPPFVMARAPPRVRVPRLAEVEYRLVLLAVVLKKLVDVAEVEVELSAVKFWRVEEPVAKMLM